MPFFKVTQSSDGKPMVVNANTVRYVCMGRCGATVIHFSNSDSILVSEGVDTVTELMIRRTIDSERVLET